MNSYQVACIACGSLLTYPVFTKAGVLCESCKNQGLFRKKLIITGITRMNNGHVCVSGIDPVTWNFVRPVFSSGLTRDFLMEGTTQVVQHFNVVEFEFTHYKPAGKYHTEDWVINEKFAPRFIKHLTDEQIVKVLNKVCIKHLGSQINKEDKSLFVVKVKRIDTLWHKHYDKLKIWMNFTDWQGETYEKVPITDLLTLSAYRYHMSRDIRSYTNQLISRFNNNPHRFIRIGITREWQNKFWNQVTAIITVPDLFDGQSFSYYEKKTGTTL